MELEVVLYTRQNCKLCDEAKEDLEALQPEIAHRLIVVDIDQDPDLQALYGHLVPVVASGPYKLQPPFDKRKLRMTLGAARDSQVQRIEDADSRYVRELDRKEKVSTGDKVSHFISRRYLLLANLVLALYIGLPFLAPVLMKLGFPDAARPIYTIYRASCHELAFRSLFLFGEQPFYPRTAAGLDGYITYGEATGLNEGDLIAAREFIGNEGLGYKVALCQRDVAIYLSMLLFGILFALSGRKIKPISLLLWMIIGIMPVGLDGVSQLVSQLGLLDFIPYRESTPFLRILTGALFGFTTAWFGFPALEETMQDTRQYLAAKRARWERPVEKN